MEKQTVFVRRYPSKGELPDKDGIIVITTNGRLKYNKTFGWITLQNYTTKAPEWWLEEIELPSEGDVHGYHDSLFKYKRLELELIKLGANFILNKLKGG